MIGHKANGMKTRSELANNVSVTIQQEQIIVVCREERPAEVATIQTMKCSQVIDPRFPSQG